MSEFIAFDCNASLLDWDIIVFWPDIAAYAHRNYGQTCQGKPSLDDTVSVQLREAVAHWRREISDALRAGKTVFVFLNARQEVYVDTGQRQYSGTGRNRETTLIVTPLSNYEVLPIKLEVTPSQGKGMRLDPAGAVLADYWRCFSERSTFEVLVSGAGVAPLVVTKTGTKFAGALVRTAGSGGALVLLPHLDLTSGEFYQETESVADSEGATREQPTRATDDPEEDDDGVGLVWTEEGVKLGHQLRQCLVGIDAALRRASTATPPPGWCQDRAFMLPAEARVRAQLLEIETRSQALAQEKEELEGQLDEESSLRRLLFEKGPLLEDAIARALRLMGFSAARYRDANSEFDVVFESPEGRLIGEAEGKDNRSINVDKLRQLEMNLHEDLARDEVSDMAQGVLFGNAHRLVPPAERGDYFTAKVLDAVKRTGCGLVRTPDLFVAAQYLSQQEDPDFARRCREALVSTRGAIVTFPLPPPAGSGSEPTIAEADEHSA